MNTQRKLAALVATTALLVGSLAMAGTAAANSPHGWAGNGWPNTTCNSDSQSMHWVYTGKGVSDVVFFWPDGQPDGMAMTQHGAGSFYADVPYFDPTGLTGSDIYVTYTGSPTGGKEVLTLSHCDGTTTQSSGITSTVKDANDVVLDNDQNPGFAPVTAHDTAVVTFSGGGSLPDGSSVQFSFFNNIDCSGQPADTSDQIDATGSSPAAVDGSSFPQGPLAAGEYSFQAVFTSGDESLVDSAIGDCEPFVVLTQSTSGTTTTVTTTFPESSTFGNTTDPSDHSWMLIAALGVFLGSLLVLAPARAKNRR